MVSNSTGICLKVDAKEEILSSQVIVDAVLFCFYHNYNIFLK